MAIENPTSLQSLIASNNLKVCEESLAQMAEQLATELAKKAKEALDKANQMLSELPEKAIGKLNEAIELLMKIINGYVNKNTPEFKPELIIAKLEALLNPVVSDLGSLPVPLIPGLALITQLLDALKALITAISEPSNGNPLILSAEIPPELISMLNDLLNSLLSLCATLPLVLINLIFLMLNTIIGLFKLIAGIIGVPSIPYPLSLVPTCISMMPDLMAFMLLMPGQLINVAHGTLEKAYGKITSMQIPEMPENIKKPEGLPPCPKRDEAL